MHDFMETLRQEWRLAYAATVPNRLSTARHIYLDELEESLRTLEKARQVIDGCTDPPFWIRVASRFPQAKRMESLLSDPLCNWGWLPPFGLFPTKLEEVLCQIPVAKIAVVVNAFSPSTAWYPLYQYGGGFNCIVQWAPSEDWSDLQFDEDGIDSALWNARESIRKWQTFWNNDARWQREFPDEWLQVHLERVKRQIAVVALNVEPASELTDVDRTKKCAAISGAARAIRDLSIALTNDVSAIGLPPESKCCRELTRISSIALTVCPQVLKSEPDSREFWDAVTVASLELDRAHVVAVLDGQIPEQHRTRVVTKHYAAHLHSGQKKSNPTDYFERLIKAGTLTPPVGHAKAWQFDIRNFPESARHKLR